MREVGHYEKIVTGICKTRSWSVVEEPGVNALGMKTLHAWFEDEDGIPCTTELCDSNGEYSPFIIVDGEERDELFKIICMRYASSYSMSSLEELELRLSIRGAL